MHPNTQTQTTNIVEFPNVTALNERCQRLERELFETKEALFAAERRENDLILQFQTPTLTQKEQTQ